MGGGGCTRARQHTTQAGSLEKGKASRALENKRQNKPNAHHKTKENTRPPQCGVAQVHQASRTGANGGVLTTDDELLGGSSDYT